MKKLLFAFMSLALISAASAQEGADIKWNGEFRFRFAGNENVDFSKNSWDNATAQRTKIGATFTKGEDLTATVTLLSAATWGNEGATNTSGDMLAAGAESNVYVYEAFAFWKAMDNFALKIGRGALDLADGTVVAKNDYEQTPYTFEGAYGVYFTEWANIGLFGVKGMNDVSATTADINFYGLSVDVKSLPEWLKMANFHVMESKATGVGGAAQVADEKTRVGVTLKGDSHAVDYRATYAMYTGKRTVSAPGDHKASMLDAEVGYTLPDIMNLRVAALYHMDSGDDNAATGDIESYDPFFYDTHNNAGFMDLIGWGNSTYLKVGASVEPMEMTKVGVDYYMFQKTEENDSVYDTSHTAITAVTASGTDVGTEIDVWATKALSNGAELNARIGMFAADKALGADAKDVTDFSLGATFRF